MSALVDAWCCVGGLGPLLGKCAVDGRNPAGGGPRFLFFLGPFLSGLSAALTATTIGATSFATSSSFLPVSLSFGSSLESGVV